MSPAELPPHLKVIAFDGVCNFCNAWVNWVIRLDRRKQLKFTSLQGEWAQRNLPDDEGSALESVLFFDGTTWHRKSNAILKIGIALGGIHGVVARMLFIVPAVIRNRIYDWIATNRYRWFGQRQVCRVPTTEELSRFI